MRVLVTGGTGFIGRALLRELCNRGDGVTALTRDVAAARRSLPREVRVALWHPERPGPWMDELGTVDAVVHLAGAPVLQRWSAKNTQRILDSRVQSGKLLVEAVQRAGRSDGQGSGRPRVLVSASATGYYGADRGDEELYEDSEPGSGFLAEVCTGWEEAAREVQALGVRAVQLRIGVVIGPGGGALSKMILPGRLAFGGPVGRGDNYVPWVHLDDVVGMLLWALDDARVSGPVNCTAPYFTTARQLAKAAASVLGRPAIGAPTFLARLLFGEATSVLTGSLRVHPRRALALGYEYRQPELVPALEASLMA